jgi:hypothetical protein
MIAGMLTPSEPKVKRIGPNDGLYVIGLHEFEEL